MSEWRERLMPPLEQITCQFVFFFQPFVLQDFFRHEEFHRSINVKKIDTFF